MSPSTRAPGRRRLAVFTAAVTALASVALLGNASRASADEIMTDQVVTCPIVGQLTAPTTATDTPDPAAPGSQVTLAVQTSAPLPSGLTLTINSITLTVPRPAGVASVDNVTFSGGNLTGSFVVAADGNSAQIIFTGPVSSTNLQLPSFTITATLAADASGSVVWGGPTSIVSNVVGLGDQSCTAAADNPPIQTTGIQEPSTTTTEPSTTTTEATTSTTEPTTTTTEATTSTTEPTTTTTEPTTSTTEPTTSTTAPTTSTTVKHGMSVFAFILRLLRLIFCFFFNYCGH